MMRLMVSAVFTLITLALAASAVAQVSPGRIDLSFETLTGDALADVAVDITGPQNQSAATNAAGEVRFLNLAPGTYTMTARRAGFSDYLNKHVFVAAGKSVQLAVSMYPEGAARQVLVSRAAPVVDALRMTASTTVGLDDLQDIPSSRDPWVVLQTIPGVIVDRVNVGGVESGQQSIFQAKGAAVGDNTWNFDGIAITDMVATGLSPAYYDFDTFQEIQVTTGGADVRLPTPGVQVNLALKGGTSVLRGSARGYAAHDYKDLGLEIGGPLLEDRLWGWGSWSRTDVTFGPLGPRTDETNLDNAAFKLAGQMTPALRAHFTYFGNDRDTFGRDAGPLVAPEATSNETSPTNIVSGGTDLVLGNRLFLSARAAHVDAGFDSTPQGGTSAQWYVDDGGVVRGTRESYSTERPQNTLAFDGNAFRGRHELMFGLGWRRATVDSTAAYPGNGVIAYHAGYPDMIAVIKREFHAVSTAGVYSSAYVADRWTQDRLTLSLGARWDRQAASLVSASAGASTVRPDLLPARAAMRVDAAGADIVYNSVTPRVGLSYLIGARRTTVARASYAMFASQLGAATASTIAPVQDAGISYLARDLNGDRSAQSTEILFAAGSVGYSGSDPFNPSRGTSVNQIGDYRTPITHELLFGMEHELQSGFGVTAAFTWRDSTRHNWNSLTGVNASNYVQTGILTGSTEPTGAFSSPVYALHPSKVPAGGGRTFEQRAGYHQRFAGFEAGATKRLANSWMARIAFSTNSHREYFDGADALDDPTPSPGAPNKDGGPVVTETAGSGNSRIYMVLPKYQIAANTLFQWRWGINVGANWLLRQGYAQPYFRDQVIAGDPLNNLKSVLIVSDVGRRRLANISSFDMRVEKALPFRRADIRLDLDVFNMFGKRTVLARQYNLRLSGFDEPLETMHPRMVRFGARVNF